ncbi:hypothetical protein QZH41_008659 [Actinostola sp. cb2023]|nr:hypothetical protein QZH41_008659 [Actinostola sp. cb2023]
MGAKVGCLKASQSWSEMFDDTSEVDIDQAWTQKNFQSCFEKDESTTEETNLKKPYEIMNSTGGSALMWDDGGIYIFKLRVIDPHSSFCDLTAEFAVTVPDMKTSDKELPTFVVLGASSFGIILGCIVAFYIDAYCF